MQTPGVDYYGILSADGKWVAYDSDESGRGEIYVAPFPGPGGKWQISTGGGTVPFWPPGKELFYFTADSRLIAVEYSVDGTNFKVGKSRPLFGGRSLANTLGSDVHPKDKALAHDPSGWRTQRLSSDPRYELDRTAEALIHSTNRLIPK